MSVSKSNLEREPTQRQGLSNLLDMSRSQRHNNVGKKQASGKQSTVKKDGLNKKFAKHTGSNKTLG